MKSNNTHKLWAIGFAMACAATSAAALSLGKARGAVLLGQPLALTVALQADADEAAADLCFDADVYYGDIRQESSRIGVNLVRAESSALSAVRITSTNPIDEPVVTVYLRSGCGIKTSRKYVLLADLVSDLAPIASPESPLRAATAAVPLTAAPQAAPAVPYGADATSKANARKVLKSKEASVTGPLVAKPARVAPLPTPSAKSAPPQKSRLKLSILDLVDIKDPDLKISNALSTLPSEDPSRRDAASALWRSLNKSPEEIIKDEAQQKMLAEDVKSLRDISGKNQRDVQELGQRLEQAEAQRYANPVIYLLAGLLVLVAGALLYVFTKMRNGQSDLPWWRSDSVSAAYDGDGTNPVVPADTDQLPSPAAPSGIGPDGISVPANRPVYPAYASVLPPNFNSSGLDIDLGLDHPGDMVQPQPGKVLGRQEAVLAVKPKTTPGIQRGLSHSVHASLHAINTQEMLDVRQQADFFMTLGQHEEAIGLLEASIRENETSNPLVYLDLLKVLHTLSRKPAFDHYCSEFNDIFTGRVPPFTEFGQLGNSLDAYPQICNEISDLWGREGAVDFLEQCMVRRAEDAADMYFDLDAFRDLLTLHAVAGRLSANFGSDSGLIPFSAVRAVSLPALNSFDLDVNADVDTDIDVSPVLLDSFSPNSASSANSAKSTNTQQASPDMATDLDLDLGQADENLINFDISGLSVHLPPPDVK